MQRLWALTTLSLSILVVSCGQTTSAPNLHGAVTDPSGASVPGATVALRGAGPEQHTITDAAGKYAFTSVKPGKYLFHVAAKGFTAFERWDLEISKPTVLDAQLFIEAD